jgi:hypothetical protein
VERQDQPVRRRRPARAARILIKDGARYLRGPRVNGKGNHMFFFFIGRRHPFLTLIIGAAILVVGLVAHSTIADMVGIVGILIGGLYTASTWRRGITGSMRRRGITGGKGGGWGSAR